MGPFLISTESQNLQTTASCDSASWNNYLQGGALVFGQGPSRKGQWREGEAGPERKDLGLISGEWVTHTLVQSHESRLCHLLTWYPLRPPFSECTVSEKRFLQVLAALWTHKPNDMSNSLCDFGKWPMRAQEQWLRCQHLEDKWHKWLQWLLASSPGVWRWSKGKGDRKPQAEHFRTASFITSHILSDQDPTPHPSFTLIFRPSHTCAHMHAHLPQLSPSC